MHAFVSGCVYVCVRVVSITPHTSPIPPHRYTQSHPHTILAMAKFGEQMRGLTVFISDIRNCECVCGGVCVGVCMSVCMSESVYDQ